MQENNQVTNLFQKQKAKDWQTPFGPVDNLEAVVMRAEHDVLMKKAHGTKLQNPYEEVTLDKLMEYHRKLNGRDPIDIAFK